MILLPPSTPATRIMPGRKRHTPDGDKLLVDWGTFLGCWALAATAALAFGRDANWDLRNYHYYNAYALLAGRWGVDVMAAGPWTYFHPGLDLPFYLITQTPLNRWPRLVATIQAGYLGFLALLVLWVSNVACHGQARRASRTSILVAAFGLTGAATLAEAGTTFNDLPVSCLLVGALLALILAPVNGEANQRRRRIALPLGAGALAGAAAGFKLTATVFLPGFVLAGLITAPPGVAPRLWRMAHLAVGIALGFAITYGPWGWFLYDHFGNPFGPFLNEAFSSPWFPPATFRDKRFLPADILQALIYPVLWARRSEWLVTEWPVADPRFAIGLTAAVLTSARAVWPSARSSASDPATRASSHRVHSALITFVLCSYVAWLTTFSILRYTVAIEVLLGVPLWAALQPFAGPGPGRWPGSAKSLTSWKWPVTEARCATVLFALTLIGCLVTTIYPAWNRKSFAWTGGYGVPSAVSVEPLTLPEASLVALVGPAVSFVAPFLSSPGIRFIGAPHPGEIGPAAYATGAAETVRRIAQLHRGPRFAVVEDPDSYDAEVAQAYGIAIDIHECWPLRNNLTDQIFLCAWPRRETTPATN